MDLYHYGDRELWYLEAEDKSWSLPVFVEWKVDLKEELHYGLIMPALCLYHSQLLLLRSILDHHDIQKSPNRWIVPKNMVEILLKKAPGVTPTYHYLWPEDKHPPMPMTWKAMNFVEKYDEPEPMGDKTFVSYVASEYRIQSSLVHLVLKAVADCAPRWMVEHRKAISLGFCTLFAAPFRANWKEVVAFKVKKWKLLRFFVLRGKAREEALMEIGLPGVLCSPHNIGIKKNTLNSGSYYTDYTIEAIPTKKFAKVVIEVEGKRLACGNSSYVRSFEKTVEAIYSHLQTALENYLHKTSLPFARLYEGRAGSYLRFLPTRQWKAKVPGLRGVALGKLPVCIVSPDSPFDAQEESGERELVPEAAPSLQKVPPLLPPVEDVRQCQEQRDLDEPGGNGANGVPLLPTGQSPDPRQPMLPDPETGNGKPSGLDTA